MKLGTSQLAWLDPVKMRETSIDHDRHAGISEKSERLDPNCTIWIRVYVQVGS
jgi:hypothetical protein